jgi:lipopolysaccharide export LptBFGC system permease protein LptF
MKKKHQQKFIFLAFCLFVAFNLPIILLFNSSENTIFGLPIIYVYIFGVWLLSILITFFLTKNTDE